MATLVAVFGICKQNVWTLKYKKRPPLWDNCSNWDSPLFSFTTWKTDIAWYILLLATETTVWMGQSSVLCYYLKNWHCLIYLITCYRDSCTNGTVLCSLLLLAKLALPDISYYLLQRQLYEWDSPLFSVTTCKTGTAWYILSLATETTVRMGQSSVLCYYTIQNKLRTNFENALTFSKIHQKSVVQPFWSKSV